MTNRRLRSVVTREGWYYLFILGFVVLGSFLRNIPLLVGLSAILATAMLLNWRWSRRLLRGIRLRRSPTPAIWAGRPVKFGFLIENTRSRLSTFSLLITQQFTVVQVAGEQPAEASLLRRSWDWLLGNRQQHYSLLDAVHPGQTREVEQSVQFHRRGEYRVGPLTLSTHFPLGLVRREWRDETPEPVLVGPALGRLSHNWVEQMLGLGWRDSQAGQIARSGDEFFNLRPFSTGDSQRWIHWRASARHNRLLVRQFQHSQSKAFSLVLDCWGGARGDLALQTVPGDGIGLDGRQAAEITERLLSILATVSEAVRSGQLESVTLTLVADTVESIACPCSEAAWLAWQRRLALAVPHHDPRRLESALQRVAAGEVIGATTESAPVAAHRSNRQDAPLVVLSPMSIDQYARLLSAHSTLPSSIAKNASSATSAAAQVTANEGAGTAKGGVGTGSGSGDFWQVQTKIRTWLTPGDAWLSSWYLEPVADEAELGGGPGGRVGGIGSEPHRGTGANGARKAGDAASGDWEAGRGGRASASAPGQEVMS